MYWCMNTLSTMKTFQFQSSWMMETGDNCVNKLKMQCWSGQYQSKVKNSFDQSVDLIIIIFEKPIKLQKNTLCILKDTIENKKPQYVPPTFKQFFIF